MIEAVFEELSVKRDLSAVSMRCAPRMRSSRRIPRRCRSPRSRLARNIPERVVDALLPACAADEVIEMSPGILTSEETFNTAWRWTESCGQMPVKTQDKPGFILNACSCVQQRRHPRG